MKCNNLSGQHTLAEVILLNSAKQANIREANAGHLENGLVLGLDALQEAGLREGKLGGGSLQVVVGLCLWHPLHKLREVALHTQLKISIKNSCKFTDITNKFEWQSQPAVTAEDESAAKAGVFA